MPLFKAGFAFIVSGLAFWGPTVSMASPSSVNEPVQFIGDLSPESIQAFIKNHSITNVDQLLASLPKRLLSNFTMAFESRSLQSSCTTKNNPRVIMYSPDDDFTLAVTGNSQPGCSAIEMMKFDQSKKRFTFKEYSFDGKPERSCTSCHGNDSRPIWFSYSEWPGFFGHQDDNLDNLNDEERSEFLDAKKSWIHQNVYRQLGWDKSIAAFPFSDNSSAESITNRPNFRFGMLLDRENAARLERVYLEQPDFDVYKYSVESLLMGCPMSSTQLKELDSNLNRFFKDGAIGSEFSSSDPTVNLPDPAIASRLPGNIFKPDWFALNVISPDERVAETQENRFSDPGFSDGVVAMSDLLESRLLSDIAASDPDFRKYTVTRSAFAVYQNPLPSPPLAEQLAEEIFPESLKSSLLWLDQKGEVLALTSYGSSHLDVKAQLCDLLFSKAEEKLGASQASTLAHVNYKLSAPAGSSQIGSAFVTNDSATKSAMQPFQKCVSCHNGSTSAPQIPFGVASEFMNLVNQKGYDHGTLSDEILWRVKATASDGGMPPIESLSVPEVAAIQHLIQSLQ